MKERLNAWWARRPRPRRGHRLALNLVLCAGLLSLLWGMAGYPLPTAEMEFRRLERSNLYPASEIVFSLKRGGSWIAGTTVQPCDVFVGVTEKRAVACYVRGLGQDQYSHLEAWPLQEGPSPLPLSIPVAEANEWGQLMTGNALLFLRVPEEAARGVAAVTGRLPGHPTKKETAAGERLENGVIYVWFGSEQEEPDGHVYGSSQGLEGCAYTLTLYRTDGSVLLEQSGHIPRTE